MTIRQTEIDRAIEAIYDTTLAPERWPDALTTVTEYFGAAGTLLYFRRAEGTYSTLYSPGLAAAAEAFFTGGWTTRDIRAMRAEERGLHLMLPCVTDEDVVTPEEMATHPYYTEFLAGQGLRWFMASSISPDPSEFVVLSVQQYADRAPFDAEHKRCLQLLARHAERALRLSCRLMRAEISNAALGDALNRVGCGVALLDKDANVIFANRGGEPYAGTIEGRRRLLPGIEQGVSSPMAPERMSETSSPFVVTGQGGAKAVVYRLPVMAATHDLLAENFGDVREIVVFLTQHDSQPVDPSIIRDMLGVTLGEARVASLVGAGCSPRETADALGITEDTARTVLKRVFAKTNVSKQSQLVALLSQLALRS